ncbi:hypothetical protein M9458_014488, partial [Cirrhinus mrigala]
TVDTGGFVYIPMVWHKPKWLGFLFLPVLPAFYFLPPRKEPGVHGREKSWHMIF